MSHFIIKVLADEHRKPEEAKIIPALKNFFYAYATNGQLREIMQTENFATLYTTSAFTVADLRAVPPKYRTIIPEYIKDYVSLNQFAV